MFDIFVSYLIWSAVAVLIWIPVKLWIVREANWKPLLLGLVLFGLYAFFSIVGLQLQSALLPDVQLQYNWGGKLMAILFIVAVAFISVRFADIRLKDFGLTWKQKPGSLKPVLIFLIIFLPPAWYLNNQIGNSGPVSTERMLYQATMPGIDEEIFIRGILLYFLSAALVLKFKLAGASITLGGVVASLLFGMAHGLFYSDGGISVQWMAILISGGLGFGLLWIRERTGSLLIPILTHNVINFGSIFLFV